MLWHNGRRKNTLPSHYHLIKRVWPAGTVLHFQLLERLSGMESSRLVWQHRTLLSQTLLRWGSRVTGIQFSGWVLMKPQVPSSASEMTTTCSQAQSSTPVIIELGRWRNLDQMLVVILSYTVSLGPLISTWACKWKFPERSCMCKGAIRAL